MVFTNKTLKGLGPLLLGIVFWSIQGCDKTEKQESGEVIDRPSEQGTPDQPGQKRPPSEPEYTLEKKPDMVSIGFKATDPDSKTEELQVLVVVMTAEEASNFSDPHLIPWNQAKKMKPSETLNLEKKEEPQELVVFAMVEDDTKLKSKHVRFNVSLEAKARPVQPPAPEPRPPAQPQQQGGNRGPLAEQQDHFSIVGIDDICGSYQPKAEHTTAAKTIAQLDLSDPDAEEKFAEALTQAFPEDVNILDVLIEKHFAAYQASPTRGTMSLEALKSKVEDLLARIEFDGDPIDLKKAMEQGVGGIQKNNKDHYTIAHIFESQKAQPYSATSLFNILSAEKEAESVVIYTPGHILPGFIDALEREDWKLYGIETSVDGDGKVEFGKLKDLANNGGAYRIVDSRLWILAEVIGIGLQDDEAKRFRNILLRLTNNMYDEEIPIDQLERQIATLESQSRVNPTGPSASLFGFGRVKVQPGDQQRIQADSTRLISREVGGSTMSMILQHSSTLIDFQITEDKPDVVTFGFIPKSQFTFEDLRCLRFNGLAAPPADDSLDWNRPTLTIKANPPYDYGSIEIKKNNEIQVINFICKGFPDIGAVGVAKVTVSVGKKS